MLRAAIYSAKAKSRMQVKSDHGKTRSTLGDGEDVIIIIPNIALSSIFSSLIATGRKWYETVIFLKEAHCLLLEYLKRSF